MAAGAATCQAYDRASKRAVAGEDLLEMVRAYLK